ncbi:MAG: MgtC/SapB family protein [Dehalococcoidia bacterium]|nr:MgtC/SapB family protein [Dehalococcoidia bacterium]
MDPQQELLTVLRLGFATVLGALVGLEREYRGYPAGVRTMALVSLGAALFTEMSPTFAPGGDTARVAAQIVTGVGFLGAGVIMREGGGIRGITTAATIWTVASLGISAARGYVIVATAVTAIVILLLEASPLTKLVSERGVREREDQTQA